MISFSSICSGDSIVIHLTGFVLIPGPVCVPFSRARLAVGPIQIPPKSKSRPNPNPAQVIVQPVHCTGHILWRQVGKALCHVWRLVP
jgi:hypothetical protein